MAARMVELFESSIGRFAELVAGIEGAEWSAPTPCAEWDVRALVNHVAGEQLWAPELIGGRTIDEVGDRYDGDVLGDSPPDTFRTAMVGACHAFAGADLDGIVHLSFGDVPCAVYLEQMLTDAEVHGWDLARALDRSALIDAEIASILLPSMRAQAELIRGSGVFGDAVEVPDDADDAAQLLALLGRTPL